MKREPIIWLGVAGALIASWLAIPLALMVFDPLPPDLPPDAFLGLGPPWSLGWLLLNAMASLCFLSMLAMRLLIVAADYVWDRASKNSN